VPPIVVGKTGLAVVLLGQRRRNYMKLKQRIEGESKSGRKGGGRARSAWVWMIMALTILMLVGNANQIVIGQPNKSSIGSLDNATGNITIKILTLPTNVTNTTNGQSNESIETKEPINVGIFVIGSNAEIKIPEGVDKSILALPDNSTGYFVVVLRGPYSPWIEQNMKSLGARIISPEAYYGYYIFSSVASVKQIANITYVYGVGQIPFDKKLDEKFLQNIADNPNNTYLVGVRVVEKPNASDDAYIRQRGIVLEYYEVDKSYEMQIKGKDILDIAKLGVARGIALVGKAIPNDEKSPSNSITPNMSQKTNPWKTDNFPLFVISVIVALSVILLIFLKLKRRN
jgi:hypothetical protein